MLRTLGEEIPLSHLSDLLPAFLLPIKRFLEVLNCSRDCGTCQICRCVTVLFESLKKEYLTACVHVIPLQDPVCLVLGFRFYG